MTYPKILIVEDEASAALEIQNCLTRLGYDILDIVSSGEFVIENFAEHKPNIILMDTMLAEPFLDEFIQLVEAASSQSAIAIVNSRVFQEAHRRNEDLETLARVSAAMRQAGTQQEMLPILVRETMAAFKADSGLIYLVDEWEEISSFSLGADSGILRQLFSPSGIYWSHVQREPFWYSTELEHPRVKNQLLDETALMPHIRSGLFLQLRTVQSVVGVLALGYHRIYEPTNTDRQTLLSLAEMGGNALLRSGIMELLEQRVRDRTRELTTLYDISVLINQSLNLKVAFENSLQKIISAMSAQAAAIYQIVPPKTLSLYTQSGIPASLIPLLQEVPLTKPIKAWLARGEGPRVENTRHGEKLSHKTLIREFSYRILVPIRVQNTNYAILMILWDKSQELVVENIALLTAIAERMSTALHTEDLRKLAEKTAILEERQRLARDLHDSVSQSIYSLTLLAESAKDLARLGDSKRLESRLTEMSDSSLQALKEMRLLLYELRQSIPEEMNFQAAIRKRMENVEHHAGIETELLADETIKIPLKIQEQLYLIANEALNNSLKHSRASKITVNLQRTQNRVVFEVADNGIGFDMHNLQAAGMGLSTMRERVKELGGTLRISSELNNGTAVLIEIILTEDIA